MVSAAPSGMSFELFVARRYLRAKRKSAFISIVTVIAVAGVAVGVAALIVAMAINNGVQKDLREHLLSANADVQLLEKEPGSGIADWQQLIEKLSNAEHVVAAAPALYGRMMVSTPIRAEGCILKGVNADSEREVGGFSTPLSKARSTRWWTAPVQESFLDGDLPTPSARALTPSSTCSIPKER